MPETDTIEHEVVRCSNCGKELEPDKDVVLQLRSGYVDVTGEFFPDHDIGYYCSGCM